MKPESLHALLIDRELGELPCETVELLEAWLAEHPESAATAAALRRTLATTRAAVRRFPELARAETNVITFPGSWLRLRPFAWAASLLIMFFATAWLGFRAGQESAPKNLAGTQRHPVTAPAAKAVKQDGPWARYALASDPRGGLTVVRRAQPQP